MSTSLTDSHLSSIVSILYKARTDRQVKLRFGARKRIRVLESIRSNKLDKKDYRYQWLKETRDLMLKVLTEQVEIFNKENTFDAVSLNDMIDVAEAVSLLLRDHD